MTIRLLLGVVAVFAISSTVEAAKSKPEKEQSPRFNKIAARNLVLLP